MDPTSRQPRQLPEVEAFVRKWQGLTDAQAAAVLAAVRKRADDWRAGTASVLGLITATLVVTNVKDSVRIFDQGQRVALAAALGVSALLGLASLWFVIRAANGPSWLDTRVSRIREEAGRDRDLRRARGAAGDLRTGQVLLALAVVVFVALVAMTWIMEPAVE